MPTKRAQVSARAQASRPTPSETIIKATTRNFMLAAPKPRRLKPAATIHYSKILPASGQSLGVAADVVVRVVHRIAPAVSVFQPWVLQQLQGAAQHSVAPVQLGQQEE